MTSPGRSRVGLVTVEGIDGAGKSTHLDLLRRRLTETGYEVVMTREPGGTKFGEKIRELLLESQGVDIAPQSEALALFAARAQHLHEVILPALAADHWVLCDRFTDATYAYQGAGRKLGFDRIQILEQWTQAELRPAVTFFLSVPPITARHRMTSTGRHLDRFESEIDEFHERVANGYHELSVRDPKRVIVVDGNQSQTEVATQLDSAICNWLEQKGFDMAHVE